MDNNEFSFEALFESPAFDFYETKKFKKSYAELCRIIECDVKETELQRKLEKVTVECIHEAHTDAFGQGFAFAVKTIKFMLKI